MNSLFDSFPEVEAATVTLIEADYDWFSSSGRQWPFLHQGDIFRAALWTFDHAYHLNVI